MIWIFILVAIAIVFLGYIISERFDFFTFGTIICAIGVVSVIILTIASFVLIGFCAEVAVIDEKIEMYEVENAKIEQQMTVIVQNYQKHEAEIFGEVTEKNVMSLVTLYPELRSDSLVEKQMEVYYDNYEKITELKEDQIMASVYRWWVYFGK